MGLVDGAGNWSISINSFGVGVNQHSFTYTVTKMGPSIPNPVSSPGCVFLNVTVATISPPPPPPQTA